MKRRLISLVMCVCLSQLLMAQLSGQLENDSLWKGSAEQKVWGLMTIWAQTKFAFPHRERLQEIEWDSTVQAFIPRVIEAEDQESYYKTLMEELIDRCARPMSET